MAYHGLRKFVIQQAVPDEVLTYPEFLERVQARLQQQHDRMLRRVQRRCRVLSTEARQSNTDAYYWMRGLTRLALVTRLYFPRRKLNLLRTLDKH